MSDFDEPCPTCRGSGWAHIPPNNGQSPCPSCVGGRVVSESVIEEMKSVIGETFVKKMLRGQSKPWAALAAYAVAEHQARAVARVVLEHMEKPK